MEIKNRNIFITGADGGIGYALLKECIELGAKKIYASGINSERLSLIEQEMPSRIKAITLDVTNYEECVCISNEIKDVDILINNAGVECATNFTEDHSIKAARFETSVNYLGIHNLCYSFKDNLLTRQEACIVNMLSVGSFVIVPNLATYCASKAAAHILTQAIRGELSDSNIEVLGVYPGYIDTEMTNNLDVDKVSPESICGEICKGIINNDEYIFPDYMSKTISQKTVYKTLIHN